MELGKELATLWTEYQAHIEEVQSHRVSQSVGDKVLERRNATFEGMLNWLVERELCDS